MPQYSGARFFVLNTKRSIIGVCGFRRFRGKDDEGSVWKLHRLLRRDDVSLCFWKALGRLVSKRHLLCQMIDTDAISAFSVADLDCVVHVALGLFHPCLQFPTGEPSTFQ